VRIKLNNNDKIINYNEAIPAKQEKYEIINTNNLPVLKNVQSDNIVGQIIKHEQQILKKEEKKSDKIRPFKNIILLNFPDNLREAVNKLIDDGHREINIRRILQQKYKIEKAPTCQTIRKYIVWYLDTKKKQVSKKVAQKGYLGIVSQELKDTEQTLEGLAELAKSGRLDKKKILEFLIHKCISRTQELDLLQREGIKAGIEGVLQGYYIEVRKIVETLAKLSGELKDDNEISITIIQNELSIFFSIVSRILDDLVPEIKSKFIDRLKIEVQKRQQLFSNK